MRYVKTVVIGLVLLFIGSTCWASTLTVGLDLSGARSPETNIYSVQMNFGITGPADWFAADDDVVWSDDQPINPVVIPGVGTFPRWSTDVGLNNRQDTLIFMFEDPRDAEFVTPLVSGDVFTLTFPENVNLSLDYYEFTAFSDSKDTWSLIAVVEPRGMTPPIRFEGGGDYTVTFAPAVPIPGAVWLLGSGLLGLVAVRRRQAKG